MTRRRIRNRPADSKGGKVPPTPIHQGYVIHFVPPRILLLANVAVTRFVITVCGSLDQCARYVTFPAGRHLTHRSMVNIRTENVLKTCRWTQGSEKNHINLHTNSGMTFSLFCLIHGWRDCAFSGLTITLKLNHTTQFTTGHRPQVD